MPYSHDLFFDNLCCNSRHSGPTSSSANVLCLYLPTIVDVQVDTVRNRGVLNKVDDESTVKNKLALDSSLNI